MRRGEVRRGEERRDESRINVSGYTRDGCVASGEMLIRQPAVLNRRVPSEEVRVLWRRVRGGVGWRVGWRLAMER